jgi:two-component SAPR family response regulator
MAKIGRRARGSVQVSRGGFHQVSQSHALVNPAAPWLRLQHALNDQSIRAETIRRLLAALDDQQTRLGNEITAAIRALPTDTAAVDIGSVRDVPETPALGDPRAVVVRCLGTFEVLVGGAQLVNWRSGKARAVFEYLVTHRRRAVPRDVLIQAIWPDPDAVAATTSLKVAVHALRQMFAEIPRQKSTPPPLSVIVQESTYQLGAPGLWVDVDEFEGCVALGGQLEARGQPDAALSMYARAADLYRGEFLAESWDDWAVFRREGVKDQYLHILARLADARFRAGDFHGCIELCRRLLEQDCCREDTFRLLMHCHGRLGQRGRVQRWYELCIQALRNALDVEPEPETHRVYQRALANIAQAT